MELNALLLGAVAMTCFIASLFFLRFWKLTRDRLFWLFALAFFMEGCCRVMLGLNIHTQEGAPLIYAIRLASYLVILFAILDKNWKKKRVK
jgi:uncharacterized membrane protein HdeD (DUF308 family)